MILLAKLQKSIYKCHSEVLQLSGVEDELSCVEDVKKIISSNVFQAPGKFFSFSFYYYYYGIQDAHEESC